MAKSSLIHDIEVIADRVSRKNLRASRAIIQLATWIKKLEDENRQLKQRLDGLDIRVKKLNSYGVTAMSNAEAEASKANEEKSQQRILPGQLKKYRLSRKLSQGAMAALIGVKAPKYARWESGKSIMIQAVEDKIREIQKLKATELRSQLQGLGFFRTNGKKTRIKTDQGKTASRAQITDSSSEQNTITTKTGSEPIIESFQIKKLRTALGYSQRQFGELLESKLKNVANWEYGMCRPPEDIAKKLRAMYEDHFGDIKSETNNRPKSSRKIYESPMLPMMKIRAGRAASGLSGREVADRLGVPITRYKNWEAGNSRPTEEFVEKMISIFGNPPTTQAKTKKNAPKGKKRSSKVSSSAELIDANELHKIRALYRLTHGQMAVLFGVNGKQYQNWETQGRRVPPPFVQKARELAALNEEERSSLLKAAGITTPSGRFYAPSQKGEGNQ